jgi:hypothetical protein
MKMQDDFQEEWGLISVLVEVSKNLCRTLNDRKVHVNIAGKKQLRKTNAVDYDKSMGGWFVNVVYLKELIESCGVELTLYGEFRALQLIDPSIRIMQPEFIDTANFNFDNAEHNKLDGN